MHPIKKWLYGRGYFGIRQGNNVTFFDGGCARVPESDIDEFLEYYANCCAIKPAYLVEKPDKSTDRQSGVGHRFVMDLDFKIEDQNIELPETQSIIDHVIIPHIQACIRRIFPDCDHTLIVCTCNNKYCDKFKKTGIHLIWKNIYVCDAVALSIRAYLVDHLDSPDGCQFDQDAVFSSWGEIIDEKVYDGSGMRAIYSHKASAAKGDCRKRVCKDCNECDGHGHVLEGRPYTMHSVYDGEQCADKRSIVFSTTLLKPHTHSFVDAVVLGKFAHVGKNTKTAKRHASSLVNVNNPTPRDNPEDEPVVNKLIKSYISKLPQYNAATVTKIVSSVTRPEFVCFTCSKHCLMHKMQHNSNHIYFVVDSKCCKQLCHSEKCRGKSVKHKLPPELQNLMLCKEKSFKCQIMPGVTGVGR